MSATRELPGTLVRASKLRVPSPRVGAIERHRLLKLLESKPDVPIVLISASAGYGKSTLAAQWSSRCERPIAWVNLDRGDNDPLVLLNTLVHALDRVGPVGPELFDELSSPAPRVGSVLLPLLAVELARLSPFELILDDLHELTQPKSLELINFLLVDLPPASQLLLVSRADPDMPLARLRIEEDVLEIRANRLALDLDETHELATTYGANLSAQALTLVHERTEGWPAGIGLALRAAGEQVSGEAIAEGIRGTQRNIADYLVEMVLDQETEQHRAFLLATSVLHRMTAPLCDVVLGTTGSGEVLRDLEHANSFIIPLDDERGWYRYHQLFGELLRSELDRRNPELAAIYLHRAAQWHEQDKTNPDEAFRCAHECGDLERAGRIALASAIGFMGSGHVETIRLWFLDCEEDEICADPQLAIAAAWVFMVLGEGEKADRFLLAAGQGDLDVPAADGATSLRSSFANVRSALAPGGINQMLADAEFVYAAERERQTPWLSAGCRAIGTANVLLGRPQPAIAAFQEALMLYGTRPGLAFSRVVCLGYLAFAAADSGAWREARKWAQEAKALVVESRIEHTMVAAIACTARATTLVKDGEFDRAAHELSAALAVEHLARGTRWLNADLALRWGNLSLDLGERLAAHEHAMTAQSALRGYPDSGNLSPRLAELETRIARAADLHLTPAELRIVPFLPTHLTVKEIAQRVHLSAATVKSHLSQIYAKVGAATRSETVAKLDQLGLGRTDTNSPPSF